MKFLRTVIAVGLLLGILLAVVPAFGAGQPDNGQDIAEGRILVKFKAEVDDDGKREVHDRHGDRDYDDIAPLKVRVVKVPAGKEREKAAAYGRERGVQFAEPDYVARAIGATNDTYFNSQWGLAKIQASQAWDVTSSQAGVKIAILDTGVDLDHTDLAAKIVVNMNETNAGSVNDLQGHGTHTAGIAAAITNNSAGVAGVGYNSSIMNVKVLDDAGSGYYSWIANGITWAADNGAKVISMSLGGSSGSAALQIAVDYAWSKGVVLVAAAGNAGNTAPSYPAYYSNVIAVAATDQNDARAGFSTYGSWVDVAAPGVSILSTLPNHSSQIGVLNYGNLSGTSMATPFVSGLAALVWSTPYGTDNASVRNRIQSTADQIAGTGSSWQYGRINAYKAVAPPAPVPAPTPTPTPTPDTTPPAQVTGLAVTTASSSQLNLAWNASTAPDLNRYNVYRSAISGSGYSLVASPTANSYSNTGLAASTTYYYVVSAVDNSGNKGAWSAQASGTTAAAPANKMHVQSIGMSLSQTNEGRYTRARAVVTILDAGGTPVAGATVTGRWSGATTGTSSAVTNSAGQVTLTSARVRRARTGTTWTLTVSNVTRSGWTYDPASNVVTSGSIAYP